ncbi:MAG: hypothetical protein SFV52_03420 [Saprospiraceae bacterium]|nr:hypothetical protein [Saprospiraceae bacterium]
MRALKPCLILPALLLFYGFAYAPFGINETDGGFLTGLAWQVLQGKILYTEVLYVRPPLPVWLHAAYLWLAPDTWAMLGERWLFYLKVMLYCWWGCGVLWRGLDRVWTTAFAFVLSAHNYPAAAWHTIDGIFFAALGLYAYFRGRGAASGLFAGACLAAAALCKQSFYPLIPVFLLLLLLSGVCDARNRWALTGMLGMFTATGVVLQQQHALSAFWALTQAAAGAGDALQHGVLDYFRLHPAVLAGSALVGVWAFRSKNPWGMPLLAGFLVLTFLGQVLQHRDFVVPRSQIRVLFWLAAGALVWQLWQCRRLDADLLKPASLLAIAWCSAVSWGYNLPVLFAVPLIWGVSSAECGMRNAEWNVLSAECGMRNAEWNVRYTAIWVALVVVFGVALRYVYRDGPRSHMTVHLGAVFPRLAGIYSSATTADLYRDLADLHRRYGDRFAVLPAFPQAGYLCDTRPLLPLDWVVTRETGGRADLLEKTAAQENPYFFVEKSWSNRLNTDPELAFTRHITQQATLIETTTHFYVYRLHP